ncbi:MAG: DUF4126 domain-containing protein [Planctomycetota bacterium]|nr:DUF4126 domain-containing protein [Planctomycetota bacterium]
METLVAICTGLGLSAACGFRVFVPLLIASVASKAGLLELGQGLEWVGSWPALAAFAFAACCEVVGYYVPFVDHALDSIATPAAVVAGTIAAASQFDGSGSLMQWATGLIAGGGTAGLIQFGTVGTRAVSTTTTAGLGNHVVATIENAAATVLSILTIVVPVFLGVVALVAILWIVRRKIRRSAARRAESRAEASSELRLAA